MYQVNKDTPLDAKLIKKAIDYNEKRRTRFDTLDDYYMGKQAITTREKVETLMNNKLVTNHAKYITDMMVGYLLGNPVDYQVNDNIDIQPVLDAYKRQTIENIGSGEGYYITNGYMVPITWEKSSRSSKTIYKYTDGTELKVNDGNTHIEIHPISEDLIVDGVVIE